MYSYGITQQGAYHVRNGTVCQDAHNIVKCGDNMAIAAVADGLGSEEHSDIASKIAVDVSVRHCRENITEQSPEEEITGIIAEAFRLSQDTIEKTADENGHPYDQYDTTLSLAVLIGTQLYYGHSGDSGIIALGTDGIYRKVTEQQRDSEGRVLPLFFGETTWVIGRFPCEVASVLLATDGVFELFFPVYIRKEPVSLYVALARFFMNPAAARIGELGEEAVAEMKGRFLAGIPERQVSDDKTLVVVMNPSVPIAEQPEEYWREPDWAELKRKYDEEWRRAAYPHLFQDEAAPAAEQAGEEEPGAVSGEPETDAGTPEDEEPSPAGGERASGNEEPEPDPEDSLPPDEEG